MERNKPVNFRDLPDGNDISDNAYVLACALVAGADAMYENTEDKLLLYRWVISYLEDIDFVTPETLIYDEGEVDEEDAEWELKKMLVTPLGDEDADDGMYGPEMKALTSIAHILLNDCSNRTANDMPKVVRYFIRRLLAECPTEYWRALLRGSDGI